MRISPVQKIALASAVIYTLYRLFKPGLAVAKTNHSLLWQINKTGVGRPSYLFGTMHLMCAQDAVLSRGVLAVLKKVKEVYVEVAMDEHGSLSPEALPLFMKDDKTLADLIEPEAYNMVRAFFSEGRSPFLFEIMERQFPMLLTSSLYELFLTCDQKNGMDIRLVEEAHRLRKKVNGLETLDFQLAIFSMIPYTEQAADLVRTIEHIDQFRQSINEMTSVYREQNIQKLEVLTRQEESGMSSHLNILLHDRNLTWVETIEQVAKGQSTLFAFGAGHLGGPKGVLALLQQKGFRVTPLVN